MREEDDILVIGGGIIGVSAAYYMARAGLRVTLVEKDDIGAGSSYGNAGLLVPCHSAPIPGPGVLSQGLKWMLNPRSPFYIKPRLDRELINWLWRFRSFCNAAAVRRVVPLFRDIQRMSLQLYRELIAEESIACHFEQSGGLSVYLTKKGHEHGRREVQEMQAFGLQMSLLDGEALWEMEPALRPEVVGAIHYREDGHIQPAMFISGLAGATRARGVQILTGTEVVGFETSRGAITAVQTTAGTLHPRQIVLAAGAWSASVAKKLAIDLPMQPAKGYSVTVRRPNLAPERHLHLGEAKIAVTPMGPELRFAGTLELAGFDFSVNRRRIDAIVRGARRYLRGLDDIEIVETWHGMRPTAPDGLPFLGRGRAWRNLVVATGHAMLGISMGPATGKLVAQLICEEPPFVELTAFDVDRFSAQTS